MLWIALLLLTIFVSLYDLRTRRIPNWVTIPLFLAGLTPGARLLDLGAGTGGATHPFSRPKEAAVFPPNHLAVREKRRGAGR